MVPSMVYRLVKVVSSSGVSLRRITASRIQQLLLGQCCAVYSVVATILISYS